MKTIENALAEDRTSLDFPSHPCMNPDKRGSFARIHLPVARKCNIACVFCASRRGSDFPGFSAGIITPQEALERLRGQRNIWGKKAVVGVSGPGEPLFNPETFEAFRLIGESFPEHPLCLCTNGLLLADKITELYDLGISSVSVTMTGILPEITKKLHPRINTGRISLMGEAAAAKLIESQMEGVKAAIEKGMFVKVNVIVVEGINNSQPPILAKTLAKLGVGIMNITPVIPSSSKSRLRSPDKRSLEKLRNQCAEYIPQFRGCGQCRSDAAGIPKARATFFEANALQLKTKGKN